MVDFTIDAEVIVPDFKIAVVEGSGDVFADLKNLPMRTTCKRRRGWPRSGADQAFEL